MFLPMVFASSIGMPRCASRAGVTLRSSQRWQHSPSLSGCALHAVRRSAMRVPHKQQFNCLRLIAFCFIVLFSHLSELCRTLMSAFVRAVFVIVSLRQECAATVWALACRCDQRIHRRLRRVSATRKLPQRFEVQFHTLFGRCIISPPTRCNSIERSYDSTSVAVRVTALINPKSVLPFAPSIK